MLRWSRTRPPVLRTPKRSSGTTAATSTRGQCFPQLRPHTDRNVAAFSVTGHLAELWPASKSVATRDRSSCLRRPCRHRMFDDPKAPKRPASSDAENQECNGWPKQNNRHRKKITSGEAVLKDVHDQIISPAHEPSDGQQKPDPKKATTPIEGRQLLHLRSKRAPWNSVGGIGGLH